MEKKYVFQSDEVNTEFIDYLYTIVPNKESQLKINEGNSITIFLDGHGLELFDENFKENIESNNNSYTEAFKYKIMQSGHPVRILSKAGKPKTCAWNLNQCTPNKNSSQFLLDYTYSIFSKGNKMHYPTLNILQVLSLFFKKSYPSIIKLLNKEKYKEHPEDRVSYSPGYESRYTDFQKVKKSIEENKFSLLKKPAYDKIFFLKSDDEDKQEQKLNCINYAFEIINVHFINDEHIKKLFKKGENWIKPDNPDLYNHLNNFIESIDYLSDEEKDTCKDFLHNVFFGEYIYLSEIIGFLTMVGFDTINIIDNTCRIYKKTREDKSEPRTSSIERKERFTSHQLTSHLPPPGLGLGLKRKSKKNKKKHLNKTKKN